MLIRNVKTGKRYEVSGNEKELYIDGFPAIVGGEITIYFEELKPLKKKINYISDSMFKIDDSFLTKDLDSLSTISRQDLLDYTKQVRANKYINTLRSNFNIISQLKSLKATVLNRNYVEVKYER